MYWFVCLLCNKESYNIAESDPEMKLFPTRSSISASKNYQKPKEKLNNANPIKQKTVPRTIVFFLPNKSAI